MKVKILPIKLGLQLLIIIISGALLFGDLLNQISVNTCFK